MKKNALSLLILTMLTACATEHSYKPKYAKNIDVMELAKQYRTFHINNPSVIVKKSTNPLSLNANTEKIGYGYQFWFLFNENEDGDYLAIGARGQYIYINPKYQTVIAVSAAFAEKNEEEYGLYVYQMIEVFRELSRFYE